MKQRGAYTKTIIACAFSLGAMGLLLPSRATAQAPNSSSNRGREEDQSNCRPGRCIGGSKISRRWPRRRPPRARPRWPLKSRARSGCSHSAPRVARRPAPPRSSRSARAADHRARISAAHQPCRRPAGSQDAGTFHPGSEPSTCWPASWPKTPHGCPCRRRPRAWPDMAPACRWRSSAAARPISTARHVRGGRDQAVLVSGQAGVT